MMTRATILLSLMAALAAAESSSEATFTLATSTSSSPSSTASSTDPLASLLEIPDTADVPAAAATAVTTSHTSKVKGKAFDRFVQIWLENTDYDKAAGDPNLKELAKEGISLTNYYALTHLSEPNYVAAAGGDYFGIWDDSVHRVPGNISTVVDLLDTKGISWAEYQENMPFSGYKSASYKDPKDGYYYYMRKHNPLIMYESVAQNTSRVSNIKNDTLFRSDLADDKLPQWFFITPNMKNDGHDTSITYAGNWTYNFLKPLLEDKNFMENTLVLITFDESQAYSIPNHVFSILLGDAIPEKLKGTEDSMFYTHYSALSTVEANWELPHLGRGDVEKPGNNVFAFVAEKTGWKNTDIKDGKYPDNNKSKPGPFNSGNSKTYEWPQPDLEAEGAGKQGVLPQVKEVWGSKESSTRAAGATGTGTATGTGSPVSSTSSKSSATMISSGLKTAIGGVLAAACALMAL